MQSALASGQNDQHQGLGVNQWCLLQVGPVVFVFGCFADFH